MTEIVAIEWRFSPDDYFEEELNFFYRNVAVTIVAGRIEARMDADIFDNDLSIRQYLYDHLNALFLSAQILTHKPYTLTRVHTTRVRIDGMRSIRVELDTVSCVVVVGYDVDFRVIDKDGNIVADSKRDRINRKASLAALVSRYPDDPVLASMLRSYDAAVRDPSNELVHLYEIRDTISTRFRGETLACEALSISSAAWSQFGRLCNNEPLRQSRHRGKSGGALRSASEDELEKGRNFARHLIEAYLQYLDSESAA